MRVAIVSRIFLPEPAAASFRLSALAGALSDAGHEVSVLTVLPPKQLALKARAKTQRYRVRRFPVLRDGAGYVRGYVPYLSFDVPLFFRLLFGRRYDLVVSEPPPTTGLFVRCATAVRRMPYAYYAADIWSEASAQTSAPAWMVRAVRRIERVAMRGACVVLSVSDAVTARVAALGVERVVTVGNGGDVDSFRSALRRSSVETERDGDRPVFVYAGTASEWHGAEVFIEAMPALLALQPRAILRFIGGGSQRELLQQRARKLGVDRSVTFEGMMPPERLAPILYAATAAVASVRPGSSYEFAFPTKLYSAVACGAPLIYSGEGPTRKFVETRVAGEPLGTVVSTDPHEIANAMISAAAAPISTARRERVSEWAEQHVSLRAVSRQIVDHLEGAQHVIGEGGR